MKASVLYRKALKRLKKIGKRILPYNLRYKPTGVYTLQEAGQGGNTGEVVHHIYPALVSTMDIPEQLFDACPAYWKPERKVVTDYVVVELPNGRLYTDNESSVALITQHNKVVENVSLSLRDGGIAAGPAYNNIFQQRFFSPPTRLAGTVFSLLTGGAGLNNISHWFMDVLPRLHLLQKSGLYDQVDWFLVPSLRYDYQRETLELLGIPTAKLIAGDEHPHVAADRVIASTAPRGNYTLMPDWLCDYLQEAFAPLATAEDVLVEEAPFIYIARSDSSIRRVLNEEELIGRLEPYGFKTIVSSKLNIRQKIKLFSNAKVVLGASGAGLINYIFCKPGTTAIEVFNKGFMLLPFFNIAQKINLDYHYLICKGDEGIEDAGQGQREDVEVEIDKVLDLLNELAEKPDSPLPKLTEAVS
ncbi:glycosyltransferase family 61 protein [Pontibacter beigongshangensis]|uniref:glycosyltransferase family 61 protein n=1 Tax=Pontibacter beigongshangensis TaxID=2574733 RepID=UPI001650BC04|nr:glycosyltransferase family 61 protein [Pontibacter beigongshangensis]